MATTRKGWRPITIKGESYRWMVKREPKYWDNHTRKSLRCIVESAQGALLIVELNHPRLDYWWPVAGEELVPVTPREVAAHIESALHQGWIPATKSNPFLLG